MKLKNSEMAVLSFIRKNSLVSRAKIAKSIGLSKPAVSEAVDHLVKLGVLREVKKGESSKRGGKRPMLLEFNPSYRLVIAVDLGGTNLRVALTDLNGKVLNRKDFSSRGIYSAQHLIDRLSNAICSLSFESESILGIGIGVPGTVEPKSGVIRYMPAFDLKDLPLKEEMQKIFKKPVLVSNDVTLNALGEMWKGAAKGKRNVLLVSLGTGTGMGIIVIGELFDGSHGMAGEIGYLITDWSREKEHDFPFGRLERWFSGYAFEKVLLRQFPELSVKEFFEKTDSDSSVAAILQEACEHLALAIANAICLLDPEIVVIGGAIGYNQYERIISRIIPVLKATVPAEIIEHVSFSKAALGDSGVLLGAVNLVQREIFVV
ncbi:MAG: ROK family protein [Pseudothermotoga sp.]